MSSATLRLVLATLAAWGPGTFASPDSARAAESDRSDEASAAATAALARYLAGAYSEAAMLFMKAFELSGHPTQLRNAARAFEQSGALNEALSAWRKLAELPGAGTAKHEEARRRIADIEARLTSAAAPPAAPASPTPSPATAQPPASQSPAALPAQVAAQAPAGESDEVWRWWVGGSGAAVAATGTALYLSGWMTYWQFDNPAGGGDPTVTRDDASAAKTRSAVGLTMLGAGAALAIAAVVWPSLPAAVTAEPSERGATVSLSGRW